MFIDLEHWRHLIRSHCFSFPFKNQWRIYSNKSYVLTVFQRAEIPCIIYYVSAMWKGLFPRIIMIGTLTALQWFIYDSVKVVFRLPRPPPPEMPASLKAKLGVQ